MNKKIYYYSPRYPEYGMRSFIVKDESFVECEKYRYRYALITNYNLEFEEYDKTEHTIHIYYEDDSGIMRYEREHRIVYLCYDKKILMERYKKDFIYERDKLRSRLKKFRRVKNERY